MRLFSSYSEISSWTQLFLLSKSSRGVLITVKSQKYDNFYRRSHRSSSFLCKLRIISDKDTLFVLFANYSQTALTTMILAKLNIIQFPDRFTSECQFLSSRSQIRNCLQAILDP